MLGPCKNGYTYKTQFMLRRPLKFTLFGVAFLRGRAPKRAVNLIDRHAADALNASCSERGWGKIGGRNRGS